MMEAIQWLNEVLGGPQEKITKRNKLCNLQQSQFNLDTIYNPGRQQYPTYFLAVN